MKVILYANEILYIAEALNDPAITTPESIVSALWIAYSASNLGVCMHAQFQPPKKEIFFHPFVFIIIIWR